VKGVHGKYEERVEEYGIISSVIPSVVGGGVLGATGLAVLEEHVHRSTGGPESVARPAFVGMLPQDCGSERGSDRGELIILLLIFSIIILKAAVCMISWGTS
jgi:hypothetical protein